MIEYGIFEDGACIEAGFYEREEAEKRMRFYTADPVQDGYAVEEMCPDPEHHEQPRFGCEDCDSGDDDDEKTNEAAAEDES